MTAAIIALVGSLAPLFVAWMLRRWAQDTPQARHDSNTADIHAEVATGDVDAINSRLARDLERLQNASRSDPKRQGGDLAAGRLTLHP